LLMSTLDDLLKQSAAATVAPSAPAKRKRGKEEALTGLSASWMTSMLTL